MKENNRMKNYEELVGMYSDFSVLLLPESPNDIACDWRTYLVVHGNKCSQINLTTSYILIYSKREIIENAVIPVVKYLKNCTSCDAIHRKELKMTREEAHKKLFNKCKNLEGSDVSNFLDVLEALGLIKFEEKKRDVIQDAKNALADKNYGGINHENVSNLLFLIKDLLNHIDEQPKIGDYVEISFDDETKRKIGILKGKRAWQP